MTRQEWTKKWGEVDLDYLNEAQYKEYADDTFALYESEGFHTDFFASQYSDSKKYDGRKFEVVRRCTTEDDFDLESLPAWLVRFEDGNELQAFPEEICLGY